MPITIAKAYEIIHLNLFDAAKKMPPDVKESLSLALDAFANYQALRALGTIPTTFRLKHEEGYQALPDNHKGPP
jgi:hypothetical protein